MKINPIAVTFWVFCSGIGFLLGGATGVVVGLVVGTGISIASDLFFH